MSRKSTLWFCLFLLLFISHQIIEKGFDIRISPIDSYLDPFLGMSLALYGLLAERKYLWKKGKSYRLPLSHILIATIYIAMLSEFIFPQISNAFVYDPVDFLFFGLGSLFYYFNMND